MVSSATKFTSRTPFSGAHHYFKVTPSKLGCSYSVTLYCLGNGWNDGLWIPPNKIGFSLISKSKTTIFSEYFRVLNQICWLKTFRNQVKWLLKMCAPKSVALKTYPTKKPQKKSRRCTYIKYRAGNTSYSDNRPNEIANWIILHIL